MPAWGKFTIGLAAALAAGWISHGPLGRGAAFVDSLQTQADAVLARAEVPGVRARFERDPLNREAILSGDADEFQREGQGQFPGINDRIAAIPGISGYRWEN
ncbi:hypothetical protein RCO27_09590 [Sphingosinicella sp. LHD-64]|uniref:hypothetical protein n=1 Tax=Sphingosinicella sp. LHD-64 TaxID=3072139 RepID=UPI00280DA645|nr:hypothetical protein [Sphingosinicella sp. LHD-64]MDQ8756482.1 hypothetical protein [Sphingosinicella sp. LHD-64]